MPEYSQLFVKLLTFENQKEISENDFNASLLFDMERW